MMAPFAFFAYFMYFPTFQIHILDTVGPTSDSNVLQTPGHLLGVPKCVYTPLKFSLVL